MEKTQTVLRKNKTPHRRKEGGRRGSEKLHRKNERGHGRYLDYEFYIFFEKEDSYTASCRTSEATLSMMNVENLINIPR